MISHFLERVPTEHIESICSLGSKLSFMSICSIRIRSTKQDILEKLQQLSQINRFMSDLGIVVIATGTAIVTTIVASITLALLALMTLETRNDLFARFDSGLLFLLLLSFLLTNAR